MHATAGIGVIGCGYWGPKLIRNFVENRRSQVVGVADLVPERLDYVREQYGIATTTDYRHLLDDPAVDAIVIATPVHTHFRFASEALSAGKHVFVEKPLTANVQQAEVLVEQAARAGRTLMVGHTFVYNPAVVALKASVDSGELGRTYYIDSARLNLGLFQSTNVMWDLAPHDLSIVLYLLEREPIWIAAHGNQSVHPNLYDVVYLDLQFSDNVLAHVHVSWLEPCKVRRTTVVGSERMAVYNDVSASEKLRIYDHAVVPNARGETLSDFEWQYRYGHVTIPYINFSEPLQIECNAFLDAVLEGARPRSDGQAGLQVVRLLEAAQLSLNHGGIRVPVQPEAFKVGEPLTAGQSPAWPVAPVGAGVNGKRTALPVGDD